MSGSTPLLFADMPDREFWIGKKIGYGRPSFKRFKDGLKNENQPISSWLTPRQEADTAVYDINMPVVGTTEEGSKILKDLMGDKVFQYPKPLSLIRAIIEQAADGPNDIVLDFFAGSATTAHAVHEINTDDGGNRSFIMVSSTEATKKDAGKNLCRDVTARRMKAVGADFAYLRAQRIPLARLHTDISHDQIWTALQQMHAGVITQYDTENALHCLDVTDTDLFYVPKITPDVITTLAKRSEHRKPAVIYSWQPGVLQQRLKSEHFAFEKIPNFLVERFGGTQ
jgi:adenine-specific DNA-methyltransferase